MFFLHVLGRAVFGICVFNVLFLAFMVVRGNRRALKDGQELRGEDD